MYFEIADVRLEHIDEIELLEKQCFSVPWSRQALISQLPDDMHFFIAAFNDSGRVLGYVGMMYVLDEGYISNVAVSPECRRLGIADKLIESLIKRASEKNLSFVTLEVRESNLPAIELYRKNGFSDVGMRKNYYNKPTENAILMTKFLR
ncbi:MAG: ribosomal protein S18-alanine N-acetyltransferase [Oscillospiraceae bacterium]|nr:ribosomal protein S18-alanine N-acetyltransferase [Oscillospiraceae bacterium]